MSALDGIVVVLVRTEGARNAGSVARLCGNFGVELRLVDVQCELRLKDAWQMAHPCETLLDDAARFASLPEALADTALAVATSGKISGALAGAALDVDQARLFLPAPGEKLALVFGNERTGLSLEEAACCPRLLRLPTPGPVDSLNLSHAVAVALTLLAAAVDDDPQPQRRASTSRRAALLQAWEDALQNVGFYRATTRAEFGPRLREILSKMDVSERDAVILRDMFQRLGKRRDDVD
ncbi:MAG: RNA methyltransferase [Deltaproteobacteria bacterium]|nr:RNA methyltransferase [Deltaproteobacteria bacterium]